MSSRSFNRKDFLVITVTAVAAGVLTACGDETPAPGGTSGSGGTPGGGSGGMAGSTSGAGGSTSGAGGSTAGTTSGGGGAGGSGTAGGGAGGGGAGGGGAGGGGAGGGGAGGGGGGACGNITAKSSGTQHQHNLMIPMADIATGATKKYETDGENHTHWVEITAADFTALKAGMEVKKITCNGGEHEYVLKCGAGASTPVVPDAVRCPGDDCGEAENMTCQ